jgi:hypothetical protein
VLRPHLGLTLLAPAEPSVLELSLYLLHPHTSHLIDLTLIRRPLRDLWIHPLPLGCLRVLLLVLSSLRVLHGHFDLLPVVLGGEECLLHSTQDGISGSITPILGAI